ncbi:MAG: hypothetical protein U0350_44735 [Caldilineaceae bacterium]
MKLVEDRLYLLDAKQRWIGELEIEQIVDNLISGLFVPGPDFPAVAEIFQKFEEAVNVQALSVVDNLDAEIARLGLRLCLPDKIECVAIHDVQIWSDGNITCRLDDGVPLPGPRLQKAVANGQPLAVAYLKLYS